MLIRFNFLFWNSALFLASAVIGSDAENDSREVIELQPLHRPPYLEAVSDPAFGSQLRRIVDRPGAVVEGTDIVWSRLARHIYSSVAAWDCSDRLLAIRNAGATKTDGSGAWEWQLLDGRTFKPKIPLRRAFVEFRWWNTRPQRMLIVAKDGLFDYDPIENESMPIPGAAALFDRYENLSLSLQGNLSKDDGAIVLTGTLSQSGAPLAIAFSLEEGRVIVEIPLKMPRLDYATISPSGKFIVVNGEFVAGEPDRTCVFDLEGNQIGERWEPYGAPSHYDLTMDEDGREIAVGVTKTALPEIEAGSVIARDLVTGEIRQLLKGGYASHLSCRNLKLPGWAFVTYSPVDTARYPPFSNELVAVRTDGSGKFRRICQLQHVPADYWAQPQACPSSDGRLAVFATNWGDAENPVEACVVETGLRSMSEQP